MKNTNKRGTLSKFDNNISPKIDSDTFSSRAKQHRKKSGNVKANFNSKYFSKATGRLRNRNLDKKKLIHDRPKKTLHRYEPKTPMNNTTHKLRTGMQALNAHENSKTNPNEQRQGNRVRQRSTVSSIMMSN
jgi:hypothetical protein